MNYRLKVYVNLAKTWNHPFCIGRGFMGRISGLRPDHLGKRIDDRCR